MSKVKTNTSKPSLIKKIVRNPVGLLVLIYLGMVLFLSIFAGFVTKIDPNQADIMNVLSNPGESIF